MSRKKTVVSGIRPTAEDQHIGNYFGAIRHFVTLAATPDVDAFFFIADQHALTTAGSSFDAEGIRKGRHAIVMNLLAAGIDPNRATIYAQSAIPEISELTWILNCVAQVHHLEIMHHWAEKRGKLAQQGVAANAGLLTYPVLMAADILAPRADIVPVGKDQNQHVELARDLARAFNRMVGRDFFMIPDLHTRDEITVKSLTKPEEKMGKSDPKGCVFLNDEERLVTRKVTRAVSDTQRTTVAIPGDPNACNVFALHNIAGTTDDVLWAQNGCRTATLSCFDCKSRLANRLLETLTPLRERRRELDAHPEIADEVLAEGNRRARERIRETVATVKDLMGLSQAAGGA